MSSFFIMSSLDLQFNLQMCWLRNSVYIWLAKRRSNIKILNRWIDGLDVWLLSLEPVLALGRLFAKNLSNAGLLLWDAPGMSRKFER
jgi:hypothetical protein